MSILLLQPRRSVAMLLKQDRLNVLWLLCTEGGNKGWRNFLV
jgi:hypothetical protein